MNPTPLQNPNPEQNLWVIENITPDTIFSLTGLEPGMKVHFTVLGNGPYDLSLPNKEFNPNKVNDLVHKMAVDIVNVLALKGPDINNTFQPQQFYPPEQ